MNSKSVVNNNNKQSGAVSKGTTLPFYEPPPRKTSIDIINEARLAIQESQMTDNAFFTPPIKPLQTQRPFTPREKERILFGKKSKTNNNRPPSTFSLRYLQFEAENPSTPESLHSKRAKRVESRSNSIPEISETKIFNLNVREPKIKLPSLELLRPLQKKKLHKNTYSLDNLPEEHEVTVRQSESRKSFSSPQERTDSFRDAEGSRTDTPFGRPSKRQTMKQCLVLEPQNLTKIFDNQEIIKSTGTLFVTRGLSNERRRVAANESIKQSDLDVFDAVVVADTNRTVESIVTVLNREPRIDDERVVNLLNDLYDCMERENLMNGKINSKYKILILKCLYKYVESQNNMLLLNIARIILALKVTGNNLSGVCKLVFKVAKSDKNDQLFFQKNVLELFIDAIGRSSPIDDTEACVYGYGSIKFLTMNCKLLQKILSLGILPLMVLHIKIINNAKQERQTVTEQTNHVLFQLTGALRNLALDDMHQSFVECRAIEQLCQSLDFFATDVDIVSNISRTLSTVSTHDGCCDAMSGYARLNAVVVGALKRYASNEEIVVRLAYTVGNLVAKMDKTRVEFYEEKDSLKSLLELWRIYLERTLKNCSLKVEDDNSEDVMIKVIRIVANMAINPDIGKRMNDEQGKRLIDEFLKVLISNPFKRNDELVLSVLSTLNNLSFYYTAEFDMDILHVKQVDIVEAIAEYLTARNAECAVEAMRILGNLSRSKLTRNYIAESHLFKILLDILDKNDVPLLRTTAGVFVNLMADQRNRVTFRDNSGIAKLVRILTDHGQTDWSLAMLACQVIWNYAIDTPDLYALMTDDEIQQLMAILIDCLDEERLFAHIGDDEQLLIVTQEYAIWEEFASVATNLLEKIEQFLDGLDHIRLDDQIGTKTKDSSTNISFAAW